MEESVQNPYGISKTKRLTVPKAEELLFDSKYFLKKKAVSLANFREDGGAQIIQNPSVVRLVDYMGGDDSIVLAATGGLGAEAFDLEKGELLYTLRERAIHEPFKLSELKFHIYCPIDIALFIVPDRRANVNEYSGRYSEMADEFDIPEDLSEGQIERLVKGYELAFGNYKKNLESDRDFTRELARGVLGLGNFTQFYWKISLDSLLDFIKEHEMRGIKKMQPYLEQLKKAARAVAPLAVDTFESFNTYRRRFKMDLNLDLERVQKGREPLKDPYGVGETRRLTIDDAEDALFNPVRCLDHGFISPIDYMGGDESIVQAARVSYGRGTKKVSEDRGLIRYLMRHQHTTPFEMVELALESNIPLFIERQWVRHRTAEKTGILDQILPTAEFYMPEKSQVRSQSKRNKQGRGEEIEASVKEEILDELELVYGEQRRTLEEMAREGFVQGVLSSQGVGHYIFPWMWKNDLHNTFHFLGLRVDEHAQEEIRVFAREMADFTKRLAPIAWEAFEDYHPRMNAINLPVGGVETLKSVFVGRKRKITDEYLNEMMIQAGVGSERERAELLSQLRRILPESR